MLMPMLAFMRNCRVASRNFVTRCLKSDVTRLGAGSIEDGLIPGLADQPLNRSPTPLPHSSMQGGELAGAVAAGVPGLEFDEQFEGRLVRA